MDPLFRWIESTDLSLWIGQSGSVLAFPAILVVHTLGMGVVAAASGVIALRVLGVDDRIPPGKLDQLFRFFWWGLAANFLSGLLLLIAYPTKSLTNPLFYVKLGWIAAGIWATLRIRRRFVLAGAPGRPKGLAALALASWVGAIACGRLLEYTYTRLYVDFH